MAKDESRHEAKLEAESNRLHAEYDEAKRELDADGGNAVPHDHPSRRRWDAAQRALHDARVYWRSIGESVDPSHPGHRSGIKVVDNDGSAPVEG